ncbi:MAG: hypothetical protein HGB11_13390 [Chlorobiales bacterium]|nr:hypothetical protein [Chlorobiales bacterium]
MYFKSKVHHANWANSECHACGNVNPEQIFNIVESLVIDEYGKETRTRKISPKEWHQIFNHSEQTKKSQTADHSRLPSISFKIPGLIKQWLVFITRDVLSKISNTQYLIITFLEAARTTVPDPAWESKIEAVSDKYRTLKAKATEALRPGPETTGRAE